MADFILRQYCESTDWKPLYDQMWDYNEKTTKYYVTGCSHQISPDIFKAIIKKQTCRSRHPYIVADNRNQAIGVTHAYEYNRACKFYKIHIGLWKHPELTSAVLQQTLDHLFESNILRMVICKVLEHETHLLSACQNAGMEQVGRIPDYSCYKGNLVAEYIFMMKRDAWISTKEHNR